MIRSILSAALLFGLAAPVFAQDSTCYIFNRIPVTGVDEIAKQQNSCSNATPNP